MIRRLLLSLVLATSMAACKGGDEGGGGGSSEPAHNNNNVNPFAQQYYDWQQKNPNQNPQNNPFNQQLRQWDQQHGVQTQFGPNGPIRPGQQGQVGPMGPNGQFGPQQQQFGPNQSAQAMAVQNQIGSRDFLKGRIINRQFQLFHGGFWEKAKDGCLKENFDYGNLMVQGAHNFVLNFDNRGQLAITYVTPIGVGMPLGPANYKIDDPSRSIFIDPFETKGFPTEEFITQELQRGERAEYEQFMARGEALGVTDADALWRTLDLGSNFPGMSSGGGIPEPRFNSNVDPSQPSSFNSYPGIQNSYFANGDPEAGLIHSTFQPMKGRIRVAYAEPQHIVGIEFDKISVHTVATVKSGPITCQTSARVAMKLKVY